MSKTRDQVKKKHSFIQKGAQEREKERQREKREIIVKYINGIFNILDRWVGRERAPEPYIKMQYLFLFCTIPKNYLFEAP